MALKIIEAHVPPDLASDAEALLADFGQQSWTQTGGRFGTIVSAVVGAQRTGDALDRLHEQLASRGELFVLVQPLDGVLPRPHATSGSDARAEAKSAAAVSREEVYAGIADTARFDQTYVALVVLASVVAAIGLTRDNAAAVIGAMVVAPLLGPNMALALGLVLGDTPLVRRALITNMAGLALCLVSAALLGLALEVERFVEAELGPDYAWPGNVRELEQCVCNILIRGEYRPLALSGGDGAAGPDDLARLVRGGTLGADELLRRYCTQVYAEVGSYEEAARRLGLDRRTVKAKVDRALLGRLQGAWAEA